ncbi:2-thiouracil desulfurase family protein [Sedimentibacter sp. MB31-C6]|uniref:2-thiouracil desulfurase family protein n=1 Tax=Sedimentibacter sp. MB31-C6 TaxID=3109366 RepID=UPI002DDD5A06|nr:2-thiouracil desulfurase family protein [Sedimentibacter sp. MB36-C1]WSI05393.1 2-thiouracil desulfurase family protein [Sedimentibacter sp. MB36-C1]
MLFISTENLKPGMILAMDIYIYNRETFKTLLLRKGQTLNITYINKIIFHNISGAYIKNQDNLDSANLWKEELEANLLPEIRDIFFKFKYNLEKIDTTCIRHISYLVDNLIIEIVNNKHLAYRTLEYNNYDDYIFQHCINVGILSISIGNTLGLNYKTLHELGISALLHDIGMMLIPLEILNKPEKLTHKESLIIREHPLKAVNKLKPFVSNDILMGIACHHEKINGTGYPYGLVGNEIHLFGKIISICDVYNALATNRYRGKSWNPIEIFQYINECNYFDYDILSVFLKNIIVYPLGNYVKLSNGKTAITTNINSDNVLRPTVQIINSDNTFGEVLDLMNNQNITITDKGHDFEYIVSSCLCGVKCRYDGKEITSEKIKKLVDEGKAIMVCPEVLGGMPVPRLPCEIKNNRVYTITSDDKTSYYISGAKKALEIAKKYGIKKAILKEKSPSCGSNHIYDGTFSRTLISGEGLTTKLLRQNGIEVISDEEYNND